MRSLIMYTLIVVMTLSFVLSARAAEEIKYPASFNQLKGEYVLAEAKGERKSYCEKETDVFFSRVLIDRQIVSIANITSKMLLPIASYQKRFAESNKCESRQAVSLYDSLETNQIGMDEIITTNCPKKRPDVLNRIVRYNRHFKSLTFSLSENGKNKITCTWNKK